MVYRIFNKELKMKVSFLILAISIMTSSALATVVKITNKETGKVCYQFSCDSGPKAGFKSELYCEEQGYYAYHATRKGDEVCGYGNSKVKKIPPATSQHSNPTMKNLNLGR